MIDKEMVITGLIHCAQDVCEGCPYESGCEQRGIRDIIIDALNVIEDLQLQIKHAPGRNCVNCAHAVVCETVHNRRVTRANDYSPCGYWMPMEQAVNRDV